MSASGLLSPEELHESMRQTTYWTTRMLLACICPPGQHLKLFVIKKIKTRPLAYSHPFMLSALGKPALFPDYRFHLTFH